MKVTPAGSAKDSTDAQATKLMQADLEKSGLKAYAKRLGCEPLITERIAALTKSKCGFECAYRLPYFDADGKRSGFYRLRALFNTDPNGSYKGAAGASDTRYWQPLNTAPQLYLPPLLEMPWSAIRKDASIGIAITEGEKKSAAACVKGIVCAGLGGVWSFQSKKKALELIPDLKGFEWKGRIVELCFDSDVANRPDLLAALSALARELILRGSNVRRVDLPSGQDGEKVGLDDFLRARTLDEFEALAREPIELREQLCRLNGDYAVLESPAGQIVRIKDGELMTRAHFVGVEVANRKIKTVMPTGITVKIGAGDEWLGWEFRNQLARVDYRPGLDRPICTIDNVRCYNRWQGLAIAPEDGDVRPFLALVDHVFQGATNAERDWFLSWLAYPLQKPGARMRNAVVVMGAHWIGKDLIAYIMGRIYGRNFKLIGPRELWSDFTGWLADRQFINVQEISSKDHRADADFLKALITREEHVINPKYGRTLNLSSCASFYFTSNHPDPLFIDKDEGRYFVFESKAEALGKERVASIMKWLDERNGAARLLHYLLDYKITAFKPNEAALVTSAQIELADAGLTDLNRFAREVLEDPYGRLATMLRDQKAQTNVDLWTTEDLIARFKADHDDRSVTDHALANAMRNTHQIFKTKTVMPLGDGRRRRLWVVAHFDYWRKALATDFAYEYSRHKNQMPQRLETLKNSKTKIVSLAPRNGASSDGGFLNDLDRMERGK